jgi:hypothetical protein
MLPALLITKKNATASETSPIVYKIARHDIPEYRPPSIYHATVLQ